MPVDEQVALDEPMRATAGDRAGGQDASGEAHDYSASFRVKVRTDAAIPTTMKPVRTRRLTAARTGSTASSRDRRG